MASGCDAVIVNVELQAILEDKVALAQEKAGLAFRITSSRRLLRTPSIPIVSTFISAEGAEPVLHSSTLSYNFLLDLNRPSLDC